MNFPKFEVGSLLVMKKRHPCGSETFKVMRTGSDVRIECTGCGRDLTLPREKLEKSVKKVVNGN